MNFFRPHLLCLLATAQIAAADLPALAKQLASAQAAKDPAAITAATKAIFAELGAKAGTPEELSEFVLPDDKTRPVEPDQVPDLFTGALEYIQEHAWWKTVKKGSDCEAPLRGPASVVEGCLAARAAGCATPEILLQEARAAADFLVQAQLGGGRDCFPFPGWRGKRGKLGGMAERFLSKAEAAGKTDEILHDGWIIDDLGSGDLFFDNGLAGTALLSIYEVTKDDVYLTSARKAADWAIARPCVPNWNYNSFHVQLLSRMHRVTGEAKYLAAAKEKCLLGCLPGQLLEGPHAGRWADPHNAKLVYHFILLRGILNLLQELPASDPDHAVITRALEAGLKTRNAEIIAQGGTNPDTTLEVYCQLLADRERFAGIINRTETEAAAKMTFRAVVEEFKNEHPTVSPGSWGRYLALTANKPVPGMATLPVNKEK